MATVCGASLSMMDAGVPLPRPVAGIAMGLIKEGDRFAVLSDILGDEDHLGDMDFKVAGTERGVTSLQMDIKITGITAEIMRTALAQARDGRLLVLVGGAYGRRMVEMRRRMGRVCAVLETPEAVRPTAAAVAARLAGDAALTDVALVHCETTTGILNPLEDIAAAVAAAGRRLHVDAMSAFGGIPVDLGRLPLHSLAASANKCLEGAPGVGFVVARSSLLAESAGNAHALSLDLHAQWAGLEADGQWRFTPPTHVLAALDRALDALDAEGGVAGRFARYWENCRALVEGMRGLGFETLLDDAVQAPVIVTFLAPADPAWGFAAFYGRLAARGFLIYPGKLAARDSFRVGCIGAFRRDAMERFVDAAGVVLREMGVASAAPARR